MRTILSVIDSSNETENFQQMWLNDSMMNYSINDGDRNDTVHPGGKEECGIWNEEYEIINSTIQVRRLDILEQHF